MSIIDDREKLYLECDCTSFNHVVLVTYDPDGDFTDTEAEQGFGDVYIETQLNTWRPWYSRLWLAIRYVFGFPTSPYGHYDETIVTIEDRRKLLALLKKSVGE